MGNGNGLIKINIDGKPVATLIEKLAAGAGIIYEPTRIVRKAKAEAEVAKIKAIADVEVTDIQQRGLVRMIQEEGKKQENIESIIDKALPDLSEDAKPEQMDNDWIANFFDKCKLVSDEDMQILWAKLLAGEANKPKSFSKRTIELVSTLDRSDALLFTRLCSYCCWLNDKAVPFIYRDDDGTDQLTGINFGILTHLDEIGLITFNELQDLFLAGFGESAVFSYNQKYYKIDLKGKHKIVIGNVKLTQAGEELAPISGCEPDDHFVDYLLAKWNVMGHSVKEIRVKTVRPILIRN